MGAGNGAASNGTQAYVNGEGDGKVVVVSLNTTKISFFCEWHIAKSHTFFSVPWWKNVKWHKTRVGWVLQALPAAQCVVLFAV